MRVALMIRTSRFIPQSSQIQEVNKNETILIKISWKEEMCWNFHISVAAASLEAGLLLLIMTRACRSSEPRFHQQISLLPILSSILLVEIVEAIMWHDQNSLKGIRDADEESDPCPRLNHRLTLALWMIIWTQPYSVIFAARKSGDPSNDLALKVSQNMSVLFWMAAIGEYLYAAHFARGGDVLSRMGDSRFKSYLNRETCTYVGLHEHLHWTIAMPNDIFTPNAFSYAMLFLSTTFSRPKHVIAVPSLVMMIIFFLQSIWFEGSFEAGSMWCFTAIVVFVYFTVQPWVWPGTSSLEAQEYHLLPLKRTGSEEDLSQRGTTFEKPSKIQG